MLLSGIIKISNSICIKKLEEELKVIDSKIQETDFDYQYQWKHDEASVTVVINQYGIVEKII